MAKNFLDEMEKWVDTLSDEDNEKFFSGIGIQTLLILFKHFPDSKIVQELLKERI